MLHGQFEIRSRAHSPEIRDAAVALEDVAWGDLGFLNYTAPHQTHYSGLLDTYADLQLCLVDRESGSPVALGNCVPVHRPGWTDDLPEEGWDWLVESAGTRGAKSDANLLGALAISVPPAHRGKGYATLMIRAMRALCEEHGFEAMIAPVRPTAKCRHPHAAIDDYITWRDERGRLYDPWLRAHLSQGGSLVGPCEKSMVVHEHLAFWETWAGRRFEESGSYLLEGALVPLDVDVDRQEGRYEEPNVWVTYRA